MAATLQGQNREREFKVAQKMKINRETLKMALGLSSLAKEWNLVKDFVSNKRKKNVKSESTMFQTNAER